MRVVQDPVLEGFIVHGVLAGRTQNLEVRIPGIGQCIELFLSCVAWHRCCGHGNP